MRLIDADALIDEALERYCKDCDKRKGVKNGKYRIIYEIGEAPCRACSVDDMKDDLENAPTIEPVKRGKWEMKPDPYGWFDEIPFCSACGCTTKWREKYAYCPNCGAIMNDDWEEPEINPCRGCDDYDGRGGCKSHGGCGAEGGEDV